MVIAFSDKEIPALRRNGPGGDEIGRGDNHLGRRKLCKTATGDNLASQVIPATVKLNIQRQIPPTGVMFIN